MFRLPALISALLVATPLAAQPSATITPADLLRHIRPLASDEYQGRAPGTEGETRTIAYIAEQMAARGLEPAGENGGWYQPVALAERATRSVEASFSANGRAIPFDLANLAAQGSGAEERIADAPVVFAGHGARIPALGVDQLAGAEIEGAVVLIVNDPPRIADFPSLSQRVQTLASAGAAAVIVIAGPDIPWNLAQNFYRHPGTKLAGQPTPKVIGAMPQAAAQALLAAAGSNLARLLNDQPGSSFRAVTLPLRATLNVRTDVRRYSSNNVIGRLRGSGSTGENLLFLAHWDHFGTCRPEGEADRICNGAVDNASGIAMLIEVAGGLARAPRPVRDVLFLATTSEEVGLLGAGYFAAHPLVPLASIVAAVNMDTVAIHPAGTPVAVMGRGLPPLDAAIDATIQAMGRTPDTDAEANELVRRQDGWALTQAGVPTIMIGGSFSDMNPLNGFLSGRYHKPDDQADERLVLDGAAEDANLTVALGRRLADPAQYQRPPRATP